MRFGDGVRKADARGDVAALMEKRREVLLKEGIVGWNVAYSCGVLMGGKRFYGVKFMHGFDGFCFGFCNDQKRARWQGESSQILVRAS